MIKKKVLSPDRIRSTGKRFSFIPHRFLTGGFLETLNAEELGLYTFLVLASDRNGVSFYGDDRICAMLHLNNEIYQQARHCLIRKNLIVYDGTLFQVLSLPSSPSWALQ